MMYFHTFLILHIKLWWRDAAWNCHQWVQQQTRLAKQIYVMGQSWLTFGPLMPDNSRLCRPLPAGWHLLAQHHLPLISSVSSLCPFQILPGGRRRRVSVQRRAVMGLVMWRVCTHTTAACPGVLTKTESHLRVGPTAWMSCCTENTPSFKKTPNYKSDKSFQLA